MPTQTIVASRLMISTHIAVSAACVLFCAWAVTAASLGSTTIPSRFIVWATVGIPVFAVTLVASIVRFVQPYRLVLGPDALLIKRSFSRVRHIPWDQVEAFTVSGDAQNPHIGLRYVKSLGLASLAAGSSAFRQDDVIAVSDFPDPPADIAAQLNARLTVKAVQPA